MNRKGMNRIYSIATVGKTLKNKCNLWMLHILALEVIMLIISTLLYSLSIEHFLMQPFSMCVLCASLSTSTNNYSIIISNKMKY